MFRDGAFIAAIATIAIVILGCYLFVPTFQVAIDSILATINIVIIH